MKHSAAETVHFKRSIGLVGLVLYGLGVTIGAGIYVLVGETIVRAGPYAPAAFLLSAIVMGFTAASFAELSGRVPQAAGEAVYVEKSFGLPWLTIVVGLAVLVEALLSVAASATEGRGLTLAQGAPDIGDEVILIGFATGLRALLAQAGSDFLTALQETGETDFWTVATRLSEQDRIAPLASRGIIAQITSKAVIYDAETTVGGSGGPALDRNGHVVAVNAAILPEFGGANIGVPVHEVRRLLDAFAAK